MRDFNFKIKLETEIEYTVYVYGFKPGRPAPFSQDPSRSAFSDPGDPDEWASIDIYYPSGSHAREYSPLYENQKIIDKIIEIGNLII